MTELKSSLSSMMRHKVENSSLRSGTPFSDVIFSRKSGIHPSDVSVFRNLSQSGYIVVTRCPKLSALGWHGVVPPKPAKIKEKTGTSGVVVTDNGLRVSDYDLMCIWKRCGNGNTYNKVFVSAKHGAPRGPFTPEARGLIRQLNMALVSKIQHGCQDDFHSIHNPGVKPNERFATFKDGKATLIESAAQCAEFYQLNGMYWPYNATNGAFVNSE